MRDFGYLERALIEASTLAAVIERQIRDAVDQSIEGYVEQTIAQLTLDPIWVSKIENLVNQTFVRKFNEKISLVDFNSLIRSNIDEGFERYQEKLLKTFKTNGVSDTSSKIELEISDDSVIVQHNLTANSLSVSSDAKIRGTLDINNLCVRGSINTDNRSWNELSQVIKNKVVEDLTEEWQQSLVQQVLDLASTSGINFSDIKLDGAPLVSGSTLSHKITDTSIEKVGTLRELTVAGHTDLNETLHVNRRRVGINTQDPEMALSIWDEEVSIIAGKIASQKAYIGTSRLMPLSIGINRTASIDIDVDGLVSVKKLRIGQHRVSHEREIPGYSGTRGDIVFNSDPRPDTAFAWVCLGGFKWQSIKGVG